MDLPNFSTQLENYYIYRLASECLKSVRFKNPIWPIYTFRRHFGALTGANEFLKLSYDIRHCQTFQIKLARHSVSYSEVKI